MSTFLRWNAYQWLNVLAGWMALLVMVDAFIGHYRSGFAVRAQYTPMVVGTTLVAATILAALAPGRESVVGLLRVAGWLGVAAGVVGAGFHHHYGIMKAPGGSHWLLYNLMHRAPLLAPLALSAVGALAVVAAAGLDGETYVFGVPLKPLTLSIVALALVGAAAQAALLHYRGAFNNPLMYAPLTTPLLAAAAVVWLMVAKASWAAQAVTIFLAATVLVGFVGLGMHLRGFDRMMGGLRLAVPNILDGPAMAAPALFAGFAAAGLAALHLL